MRTAPLRVGEAHPGIAGFPFKRRRNWGWVLASFWVDGNLHKKYG